MQNEALQKISDSSDEISDTGLPGHDNPETVNESNSAEKQENDIDSMPCIVCFESPTNSSYSHCENCRQLFCWNCVLYWQLTQELTRCPHCCASPWDIKLPPILSDVNANHQSEFEGFILCPACNRLGCIRCRNPQLSSTSRIFTDSPQYPPMPGLLNVFRSLYCQRNTQNMHTIRWGNILLPLPVL